jgi:hypothetical protein
VNPVVVLLAGGGTGIGLLLVVLGLRGVEPRRSRDGQAVTARLAGVERLRLRLALASAGVIVMWLVAGWPVGMLLAGTAGFVAPTLVGVKRRREAAIARTEAVAGWAEQLRDTISASAGLQEAIAVTARVAPIEIRSAVRELSVGIRRNSLAGELHRFALAVDDPAADQVAVALMLAAERRGQNLTQLLGDVAAAARDDATMRIRVETARAQTYTDAEVVSGIVLAMFGFMLALNRSYLAAFDTWTGQGVLAVIGCLWAVALWTLVELSIVRRSPRILAVPAHEPVPSSPPQPSGGGAYRAGGGRRP